MLLSGPVQAQTSKSSTQGSSTEICDNLLDDDQDGYIDCFDSDCPCDSITSCSFPLAPSDVDIGLAWQSVADGASVVATPILANLNPLVDDIPEIIIPEAVPNDGSSYSKLLIFKGDGSNAATPYVLTIPTGYDDYPIPSPTIADINQDGIPELIMACFDRRIRVFTNYVENPVDPMQLWITSSDQLEFADKKPYVADFDSDGIPEIYAGNEVFKFDFSNPDNPGLSRVLTGSLTMGRTVFKDFAEGACSPVAVDLLTPDDCFGDPDCNGLEIAAGTAIYSIDVDPNDGDGYQIKTQRYLNQMAGINFDDGYTSVADVNQDGTLDVIVNSRRSKTKFGVYVWDKDGLIEYFPIAQGKERSGGLATVANVFDDRTAGFAEDFPEVLIASEDALWCFNVQAETKTPGMPYWWRLTTVDFSGFSSCTTYDLNGDGREEILYRDEEFLRVLYGGALPFPPGVDADRHWAKFVSGSLTGDEYPIVGDIDADGETEIVVTGYTFSGYNSPQTDHRGRLQVYESAAGGWGPSRQIWNQYAYFNLNITDDLTVPPVQQMHHLEFPEPGSGNRPFNKFLSQTPILDANYQPLLPVADAAAEVMGVTCAGDSVWVELQICNSGDKDLGVGVPVAFYTSDPTNGTASLLGTPVLLDKEIPAGLLRRFCRISAAFR